MRGSGRWIAYLAAVGAGVLAVLARLALVGLFPSSAPSLTLFVAVALTSLAFGIGPGLLTVATGLAGTVLVVLPSLSGPGLVGPQLFAIIGVSALNNSLIAVLGGLQFRTRRRAEQVEARSVVTEAERVTLERELEAERARLQTLLRELPAGVVMRDRAGRLLYSNPEAERLLGTPIPTSMTGAEPIYGTMHHPDGRPFPFEDLPGPRAIRRNETVRDVELLVERADGATSLLSASAAPVHDADGQVAALISVFMDLAERRRGEAALAESRGRLEFALEAGGLAAFDWLPENGRIVWSPTVAAGDQNLALPITPDAYFADVHPDDRARVEEEVRAALAGGHDLRTEYRIVRADGTRWVEDRGTLSAGRLSGVRADITERRLAEEAARRSQRLEAMGQLAAGIAHDTNNMMAGVLGYGHMMRRTASLPEPLQRDLDEIIRAAERTSHLTRQLLMFSRRQLVTPETFELDAEIAATRDMLVRTIGAETVLDLELGATSCWVTLDRTQLVQVLLNLALNARDAMRGGGRLTIATRSTPDRVVIEVRDTGTGMDEITRQRAVEPFFTTKEAGRGTGLGLSTVHGIVTQAGGSLELSSRPGAGTTVGISLPSVSSPEGTEPPPAAGDGAARPARARVLVVDDEAMVREMTARMLEDAGYEVVSAASGQEALRAMGDGRFDLLVTDLTMPEMSGRDLALRARSHRPDLPILFITGHHAADLEGLTSSRATVLHKPYSPDVLVAAAERLLRGQGGRNRASLEDSGRVSTHP